MAPQDLAPEPPAPADLSPEIGSIDWKRRVRRTFIKQYVGPASILKEPTPLPRGPLARADCQTAARCVQVFGGQHQRRIVYAQRTCIARLCRRAVHLHCGQRAGHAGRAARRRIQFRSSDSRCRRLRSRLAPRSARPLPPQLSSGSAFNTRLRHRLGPVPLGQAFSLVFASKENGAAVKPPRGTLSPVVRSG